MTEKNTMSSGGAIFGLVLLAIATIVVIVLFALEITKKAVDGSAVTNGPTQNPPPELDFRLQATLSNQGRAVNFGMWVLYSPQVKSGLIIGQVSKERKDRCGSFAYDTTFEMLGEFFSVDTDANPLTLTRGKDFIGDQQPGPDAKPLFITDGVASNFMTVSETGFLMLAWTDPTKKDKARMGIFQFSSQESWNLLTQDTKADVDQFFDLASVTPAGTQVATLVRGANTLNKKDGVIQMFNTESSNWTTIMSLFITGSTPLRIIAFKFDQTNGNFFVIYAKDAALLFVQWHEIENTTRPQWQPTVIAALPSFMNVTRSISSYLHIVKIVGVEDKSFCMTVQHYSNLDPKQAAVSQYLSLARVDGTNQLCNYHGSVATGTQLISGNTTMANDFTLLATIFMTSATAGTYQVYRTSPDPEPNIFVDEAEPFQLEVNGTELCQRRFFGPAVFDGLSGQHLLFITDDDNMALYANNT